MEFEPIFDQLEISAKPFALCQLRGSCELGLKQQAGVTLHYVLFGQGEIVLPNRPPIPVEPGTLALIPTKYSHSVRSVEGGGVEMPQCEPIAVNLTDLVQNGSNPDRGGLLAICSTVEIGFRGTSGVINLLREPLIADTASSVLLRSSIDQMLVELSYPMLGSHAIIRTILLQCMIELFRMKILENDAGFSWMMALKDEGLWAAVQLMLDSPSERHTVESLAKTAGMSRSVFAERFSQAYGDGPMVLMRNIRMTLAANMLRQSKKSVDQIAALSGFDSRSAFSRAFKAATGVSPAEFRQGR